MNRPLRWYWVLLLSLGAYCAAGAGVIFLVFGWGRRWPVGSLYPFLVRLDSQLSPITGDDFARYLLILVMGALPALAAMLLCLWLRRGSRHDDAYLHCLKCGYILKGISEPRCPECGERI